MVELLGNKCKNCGNLLDLRKAVNGVIECEYCHSPWTVPKQETASDALKYLHDGTAALDVCKFEDAFTYFQKAAESDKNEPEAYFGMALAQFKVQYLKDEVNDCLKPICHEISEKVFTENKNYKKALELATVEQKKVYRKRGGEIDDIRDEFFELKKQGTTFDCFICVKVTEEDGSQTKDRERASMIYEHLKDKGYKPFYSEREMKGRTGSAYEALILYALYTSECMLLVCSNEDYLQTKWVKNEYTRFISLIQESGKERDALTFVFAGKPIEKLPNGKKIQGIDLTKPDAYSRITEYVENHTPEARKKARSNKNEVDATRLQQIVDEQKIRDAKTEKMLSDMQKTVEVASRGARATSGSLLTRAWQEMDARNFLQADRYFTTVLDADPKNVEAWRGKFLAEFSTTDEIAICNNISEKNVNLILESPSLKNYLKYKTDKKYDTKYVDIYKRSQQVLQKKKKGLQNSIKVGEESENGGCLLPILIISGIAAILGTLVWLFMRNLGVPWIACFCAVIFVGSIIYFGFGGDEKKTKEEKEKENQQKQMEEAHIRDLKNQIKEIDRLIEECNLMISNLQKTR